MRSRRISPWLAAAGAVITSAGAYALGASTGTDRERAYQAGLSGVQTGLLFLALAWLAAEAEMSASRLAARVDVASTEIRDAIDDASGPAGVRLPIDRDATVTSLRGGA